MKLKLSPSLLPPLFAGCFFSSRAKGSYDVEAGQNTGHPEPSVEEENLLPG